MTTEQVILGLFLLGVSFTLRQIYSRINKNETELKSFRIEVDTKIGANYDTIRSEYKDLTKLMETNKQEILSTLARTTSNSISKTYCDLKQELWNTHFDNMLDKFDSYITQNEIEHAQVVDTMNKDAVIRTQEKADIVERLDTVSECLHKLQQKKEC